MKENRSGEPYINVWFGNFYRPAYDDTEFVDESVKVIKGLGFNSILMDSKAWEDFRERYNGGKASQYVAQQEYMQKKINDADMGYEFMALYLNADNLYPNIRFSPPIYGESVTNPDGSDGKWYRYWSDKAKDSMIEHLQGLMKTYGTGVTYVETDGQERIPMCTMWDPIVAPSFDDDGKKRYISWLEKRYGFNINKLNAAYNTSYNGFDELEKEDYWFSCKYSDALYTKEELDNDDPKAVMWIDNMAWRADEIVLFFKDMNERIHSEVDKRILTCPALTQWSYLLNVDTSQLTSVGLADLWDTANRGIDIYHAAKYTDCGHFISVPITPYGDPDAYVVSCQHSMMRAMNPGREFIGGIYWGRFLYNHIYEFITPAEIIGTMVGNGVSGYSSYGFCGLDDGGVLHRMDKGFNESLKTGNEWARKVIPMITGKRKKQVAILFPNAMATYEPMGVENNKERRYDLLGYYRMCSDHGYMTDVIDINAVAEGVLEEYEALIIPENDCYRFDRNIKAEQEIEKWANKGGVVIVSPGNDIAAAVFNIKEKEHEPSTINYTEGGLAQSDIFRTFEGGEVIAEYRTDKAAAAVRNRFGSGTIYSLGFAYGYSYCAKIAPHVPLVEKNNELYPINMMKNNIVNDILNGHGIQSCEYADINVETAVFEDGVVVINHTSQPIEIEGEGEKVFQYDINDKMLMPRSAVLIKKQEGVQQ